MPPPPPDPTPHEYTPWTPPGAPPPTRLGDALRPIALIGLGAIATALLTAWLSADPGPAQEAAPPLIADAPVAASAMEAGAPATLLVDSDPTGATVWMDGDSAGVTPLWLEAVEPGTVRIRVQSGRATRDTTLRLAAAEDASVDVRFPVRLAMSEEPSSPPREILEDGGASTTPERTPPADPPRRRAGATPTAEAQPARAPRVGRAPEARPAEAPRPALSTLRLASDPAGASVWIGGAKVGETPLSLDALAPGEQRIELRAPGFETERLRLDLEPGARLAQTVVLRSQANLVTVATNVASEVFVDGARRGDTDGGPLRLALAAGRHTIRVVHPERGEETRTVDVVEGTTLRLIYRLALPESEDEAERAPQTTRRGW